MLAPQATKPVGKKAKRRLFLGLSSRDSGSFVCIPVLPYLAAYDALGWDKVG